MSFATIFIPASGIAASYTKPQEFHNAIGIYLIIWFMVTFFLLCVYFYFYFYFYFISNLINFFFSSSIAALRKSVAFISLFVYFFVTFILLAAANFIGSTP